MDRLDAYWYRPTSTSASVSFSNIGRYEVYDWVSDLVYRTGRLPTQEKWDPPLDGRRVRYVAEIITCPVCNANCIHARTLDENLRLVLISSSSSSKTKEDDDMINTTQIQEKWRTALLSKSAFDVATFISTTGESSDRETNRLLVTGLIRGLWSIRTSDTYAHIDSETTKRFLISLVSRSGNNQLIEKLLLCDAKHRLWTMHHLLWYLKRSGENLKKFVVCVVLNATSFTAKDVEDWFQWPNDASMISGIKRETTRSWLLTQVKPDLETTAGVLISPSPPPHSKSAAPSTPEEKPPRSSPPPPLKRKKPPLSSPPPQRRPPLKRSRHSGHSHHYTDYNQDDDDDDAENQSDESGEGENENGDEHEDDSWQEEYEMARCQD